MQLEQVRAIVTGAASGLGRCFATELARHGASVAAVDVNTSGLEELNAETKDFKGEVITTQLDVTNEAAVVLFMNKTSEKFGGVNVLVNNAAILRDGPLAKKEGGWTRKLPTAVWKQVLEVNLTAPYLLAREMVADALQRQQQTGLIVNISSLSRAGNPHQSNYSASKAGLDACTRTWALELASYGIRVAGIAPGLINTPMLRQLGEDTRNSLIAGIPLQRIGTPYEIWLALRFIIECDYFTGRVIEVDGGSTF
jgi:3-oxoacyl-[acyl-carrier protein] reductase